MGERTKIQLGTFELVAPLARGGTGEVWQARHTIVGRPAAVKLVNVEQARDERHMKAFEREVASIARLDHPSIVRVYDFGFTDVALEASSHGAIVDGTPWLAMELARRSLREVELPLPFPHVRALLLSILDALAHAHARGVVHRDLKPGNVLFDVRERRIEGEEGASGTSEPQLVVKLTDFGIAHAIVQTVTESRSGGGFSGTPAYIAPEQLLGTPRDIGPWTDLYSLGVLAYELATGTLPFVADTLIGLIQCHVAQQPRPLDAPGVPPAFGRWVARLLEKTPAKRFLHASHAAWALLQIPVDDDDLDAKWSAPALIPHAQMPGHDTVEEGDAAPEIATIFGDDPHSATAPDRRTVDGVLASADRAGPAFAFRTIPLSALTFAAQHASTLAASADTHLAATPTARDMGEGAPPLPETWEAPSQEPTPTLPGAGLSLLGLRLLPMLGRERERDVLWQQLRRVHETGQGHGALISGPRGWGKSRLAQWLAMRAYEVGGALVIRVNLHRQPRRGGALARSVARYMRLTGETPEHARERVRAMLGTGTYAIESTQPKALRQVAAARRQDGLERDVDAILDLVAPLLSSPRDGAARRRQTAPLTPVGQADVVRGRDTRLAGMMTMLRHIAAVHPVVLWLDDAHHSADAQGLAHRLLEAADLRALVVVTAHVDALDQQLPLRTFARHPRVATLALEPLRTADQILLVEQMLGLDGTLAEAVNRSSAGNPAAAVETIHRWANAGELVPSPSGFRRRSDDSGSRVAEALPSHPDAPADRARERLALTVAAVLGGAVDRVLWSAIGQRLGGGFDDGLVARLVADGLCSVDPATDVVRIAVPGLAEHLVAEAKRDDAWGRIGTAAFDACASMRTRIGVAAVLAELARTHGHPALAVEAHLDAARDALGNPDEALAHLAERERMLRTARAPEDDPRWAEGWLVEARVLLRNSTMTEARETAYARVSRASDLAAAVGDANLAAEVAWVRGYGALVDADFDTGIRAFGDALARWQHARDGHGIARAHAGLGEVHRGHGDLRSAARHLSEAVSLYRSLGDRAGLGRALAALAQVHDLLGDTEGAEAFVTEALPHIEAAADSGALAVALRFAGSLARRRGDVARSLTLHEAAWHRFAPGDPDAIAAEEEMAFDLLALDRTIEARTRFVSVCAASEASGRSEALPALHAGLMACAASEGAWDDFDVHYALARHWLADAPTIDELLAEAAERAGKNALDRDAEERGAMALELALEQWRALGASRSVVRVMRALDRMRRRRT